MTKRKIILIVIAAVIILPVIYNVFFKKEKADFTVADVVKGTVIQEVSETGQIKMGKAINLGFKNAGTIQSVFAEVGDQVWPGTILARLSTTQLVIERDEAQAALAIAQAKLDKLLAGATTEEIRVVQTDLTNAKQSLQDTIDGSYEKGIGVLTTVNPIQETYFNSGDQESMTVKDKESNIENVLSSAKGYIDLAKIYPTDENIDNASLELKKALTNIYTDLTTIRNITETVNYKNTVTLADKTSLDTSKTNINTALTNLNTAQGAVEEARDDLALELAAPAPADIALYQAQVAQAQADVALCNNQIDDATLRSLMQGRVTKVNKRAGETWQPSPSESVVTILPVMPYDIEVDIYEEDVVKVKINDTVAIKLPAFPTQIFSGKVISIDPAEKLVESVVYYTVTISFDDAPEGIKPGMSADVTIKTAEKSDVLVVPGAAVEKKDNKAFIQIVKEDNNLEEREIQIGLSGSNDLIEVISGLTEGEKVAISH
jgi:HlyD family secretion protein